MSNLPSLGQALGAIDTVTSADPAAAAAAAAASASSVASAAIDQGKAQAIASAQKYAQSALGPYVAPGIVQQAAAGDLQGAAESEVETLVGQLGMAVEGTDAFKVFASDVIEGEKMTAAATAAIIAALPTIAAIAGPEVATAIATALADVGLTAGAIGTGAAVGSTVPIVGTIVGAIVGVAVGLGEGIAHDFPCGSKAFPPSVYYAKFSSDSELHKGDNCGFAQAAFGSGSASSDEMNARLRQVSDLVFATRDKIFRVPNWPQTFLATYASLAAPPKDWAGDGWAYDAVPGNAPRFADQIFDLLADQFASWWIQQPGWLAALAGLPTRLPSTLLPFGIGSFDRITPRISAGPGGALHEWSPDNVNLGELSVEYARHDFKNAPFSNLRRMVVDRIPYAIASAVLGTHAIGPSDTRATYDAARAAVVAAGHALGGAIEGTLLMRQNEVGAQLGQSLRPDNLFRFTPWYGYPGDPTPWGVVPFARPIFALDRVLGGAMGAPSPAHIRAASQATVDAAVPEALPELAHVRLGGAVTTALSGAAFLAKLRAHRAIPVTGQPSLNLDQAGEIVRRAAAGDPSAHAWIGRTNASASSGHPVGIGNAEVLTLAQKLGILERFVGRFVGTREAKAIASGLHLAG
jgi:hypothetical protein